MSLSKNRKNAPFTFCQSRNKWVNFRLLQDDIDDDLDRHVYKRDTALNPVLH